MLVSQVGDSILIEQLQREYVFRIRRFGYQHRYYNQQIYKKISTGNYLGTLNHYCNCRNCFRFQQRLKLLFQLTMMLKQAYFLTVDGRDHDINGNLIAGRERGIYPHKISIRLVIQNWRNFFRTDYTANPPTQILLKKSNPMRWIRILPIVHWAAAQGFPAGTLKV